MKKIKTQSPKPIKEKTAKPKKTGIDAHIQFNGSGWVVNRVKNGRLQCSTADCSKCKELSKKLQEEADEKDSAKG